MVRTQIYLTPEEQSGLRSLARRTGQSQSELIRQAIDGMLRQRQDTDRQLLLEQAYGIWADRDDLPDFSALRREMDRIEPPGVR